MLTAIITDGMWRKSMSAVRALGRAGYKVAVTGDWFFTTSFWSRHCSMRWIMPDAADSQEEFGRLLLHRVPPVPAEHRPVLLCMEQASLEWATANRDLLKDRVHLLGPSERSLEIASSKAETMTMALELGITVPETKFPRSSKELECLVDGIKPESRSQWLVKPTHSSGSQGLFYLDDLDMPDWHEHWNRFGPSVLQQRLAGNGRSRGVSMLFDSEGALVAHFVHERIHEYPITGGPSTARVSVHDQQLLQESQRLLEHLNWRGVAMVEWKLDPTLMAWHLLEINPRFWGSLELSIRSGIDFPVLYARAARGELGMQPSPHQDGVSCRWVVPGDILRYLSTPRAERESLRHFLAGLPGTAEDWDAGDLQGSVATVLCQTIALLRPKFWKYLRR